MKDLFFAIVLMFGTVASAQDIQTHNGRVIGSYALGGMEITMFYDLDLECERKSSPHTPGIFTPDENVEIRLQSAADMVEIIKVGLTEQVFAGADCEQAARSGSGANQVTISCAGSCDCSLQGIIGDDSYVSCSCADCTMEITFITVGLQSNDTTEITLNNPATMDVPLLEEFLDFADTSDILTEVTIYQNGDDEAVLYTYVDANGEEQTVMFARVGGKTYRISCEGQCGCREVYSFETNSASCSCEDCVMTVEEVSNQ